MHVHDHKEKFQQLRASLQRFARGAVGDDRAHLSDLLQFVGELESEHVKRALQPLVFRQAEPELWEVGELGATRLVVATSMGVDLAHRALGGECPAATKAMVYAARVTAAAWADFAGCPRLAAQMRRLRLRAGHLDYLKPVDPPTLILTGPCSFDVPGDSLPEPDRRPWAIQSNEALS